MSNLDPCIKIACRHGYSVHVHKLKVSPLNFLAIRSAVYHIGHCKNEMHAIRLQRDTSVYEHFEEKQSCHIIEFIEKVCTDFFNCWVWSLILTGGLLRSSDECMGQTVQANAIGGSSACPAH